MGELKRKDYEELLGPLQEQLAAMARWSAATGARVLIILEGRDTAGKTGVINAISDRLNPRQVRTVALSKPTEREQAQWYFQRYVPHLPAAGEVVLFDRSWYNRAGVERVMGYANEAQVDAFLGAAPEFEKQLVGDGLLLFKYWLTCDQAEQERRFDERRNDPMKRWKLSPIDIKARERYAEYTAARGEMLAATHTKHAPWTLVDFNDQHVGRLTLIRDLLDRLPIKDIETPPIELPPLSHEPLKERFGALSPLPPYSKA